MKRLFGDEQDEEEFVTSVLQDRLPDGDIKTCEDFQHLNVKCCNTWVWAVLNLVASLRSQPIVKFFSSSTQLLTADRNSLAYCGWPITIQDS